MYAYGTGVTYGLCVLLLIENNGEGEYSQLIMFSELLKFLFSVYNFIICFSFLSIETLQLSNHLKKRLKT